jgi:signal transduction histidine kinase
VKPERNKIFRFIGDKLFSRRLDFRVRLFNVMAIAGICVSLASAVVGVIIDAGSFNISMNLAAGALAFILFYYTNRSGKYQRGYLIVVVAVFLILFPFIFFSSGGYHSGMPAWFIFAILFTAIMMDGTRMYLLSAAEILVYSAICIIAYIYPESVSALKDESALLTDIIVSFSLAAVSLGVTLLLHFRVYEKQKNLLDEQNRALETHNQTLKEYDEMKTTFLATVAHEVRGPMTRVAVNAREILDLLEEHPHDYALIRENLRVMEQTALRLGGIVDDLLDTVSIEQGRLGIRPIPARLAHILRRAAMEQFASYNYNQNTLVLDLDDLPPLLIDQARIEQVIVNLISNAARHTKGGEIKVALRVSENNQLVTVSDTGEGMSREILDKVFTGYVSVSKEYWRHGIGLYICRQIVEAHGGEIWIDSEPGLGTAAHFTLPATNPEDETDG